MTDPTRMDTTQTLLPDHQSTDRQLTFLVSAFPAVLGLRIQLGRVPVVLGRALEPDVVTLDSPMVSRRHAMVRWNEMQGTYEVEDLDSRNGTSIGGARVGREASPLRPGAVLRVGDVFLVCERSQESVPVEVEGQLQLPGRTCAAVGLRRAVAAAAADVAPVLIRGETGTGKEHVASEISRLSGRRPFISLNCTELSPSLVESELFGHVKGAFTGATTSKPGLFRAAEGGTLFLDEIGDLPPDLQPKLLRAVEQRRIRPVGSTQTHSVDVRVLTATHRDLESMIDRGEFRQDLYARLAIMQVAVPPLRERIADLGLWIDHFKSRWYSRRGQPEVELRFEPGAIAALLAYHWPLNLRDVDHVIHALLSRGDGVPVAGPSVERLLSARRQVRSAATKRDSRSRRPENAAALSEALERLGTVTAVARHYQCDRKQVYRWLESFGLR